MVKAVLYKEYTTLFHITLKPEFTIDDFTAGKSHTLFHITLKPQIHLKSGIIAVFTKNR